MQTIRLQVSDRIYKRFMESLNKFKSDDLTILDEDEQFISNQKIAQQRLNKVERNESKLIDFDELEKNLENIL